LNESSVNKIVKNEKSGKLVVTLTAPNPKDKKEIRVWDEEFDTVIYATGRYADTPLLNVSSAGVVATNRGTLVTNEADQTNVPHIYAIGDVSDGKPELTPVAIKAGQLLARRLFGKGTQLMDYKGVPTTVFTPFEYGMVGLSEEDAKKLQGDSNISVYLAEFSSLELGASKRKPHGSDEDYPTNALSKLVCLKTENERVLGFHYVGPNAGEITQGFALSVKLKATKKDFDSIIGIHPTDAESFCSLEVEKYSGEEWESKGGCGGGKCG